MATSTHCTATTKAGNPCKANRLKDQTVCLAHADQTTRQSVGFIPDNGKAGRPRLPRVTEVLRERVEAQVDAVIAAMFDGLEADQGVALQIKGGGMDLVLIPDHRTRLQAARDLLDRVYGRPKQQTELSGPEGGPVLVASIIPVDAEERSARAAALLKRHGHVDA